MSSLWHSVLLLALMLVPPAALAQKTRGVAVTEDRLALVIGNAAYKVDALDNPINDARLVADSLKKAGFNVTLRENLDRTGLVNAMREFGARLNESTVAVVYYAGHGELDEKNQLIGYWGGDSFALQPGIAQISESNIGVRDDNVASSEGDRYLSRLDEEYLKALAKEINGSYVRGDSLPRVLGAMKQQKPARRDSAPFALDGLLAGLAALLLLAAYVPPHPWQLLRRRLGRKP